MFGRSRAWTCSPIWAATCESRARLGDSAQGARCINAADVSLASRPAKASVSQASYDQVNDPPHRPLRWVRPTSYREPAAQSMVSPTAKKAAEAVPAPQPIPQSDNRTGSPEGSSRLAPLAQDAPMDDQEPGLPVGPGPVAQVAARVVVRRAAVAARAVGRRAATAGSPVAAPRLLTGSTWTICCGGPRAWRRRPW